MWGVRKEGVKNHRVRQRSDVAVAVGTEVRAP